MKKQKIDRNEDFPSLGNMHLMSRCMIQIQLLTITRFEKSFMAGVGLESLSPISIDALRVIKRLGTICKN